MNSTGINLKFFAVVFVFTILTACGGGDSAEKEEHTPTPLTVELAQDGFFEAVDYDDNHYCNPFSDAQKYLRE